MSLKVKYLSYLLFVEAELQNPYVLEKLCRNDGSQNNKGRKGKTTKFCPEQTGYEKILNIFQLFAFVHLWRTRTVW